MTELEKDIQIAQMREALERIKWEVSERVVSWRAIINIAEKALPEYLKGG